MDIRGFDLQAFIEEFRQAERTDLSNAADIWAAEGYKAHLKDPVGIARAYAAANIFISHKKVILKNDIIAGSQLGMYEARSVYSETQWAWAARLTQSYGKSSFENNVDHFCADYDRLLEEGLPGRLDPAGFGGLCRGPVKTGVSAVGPDSAGRVLPHDRAVCAGGLCYESAGYGRCLYDCGCP